MRGRLKQHYQVHKETTRNSYFEGQIEVGNMTRLSELLADSPTTIAMKFEFQISDFDSPMLAGEMQAELQVECQRCLQAMPTPLQLVFKLLIDASDDVVQESGLDTIYSDDGLIDIFEVAEDELILALPLVAMHDDETCNKHWRAVDNSHDPDARENPFSVLKELKATH
ncbi:MAG: hypothetical protein GY784_01425 [Gammaproteobacteria bacterium]|nr:hypothetical protein [Gammaproteobacteria bacterium]